MYINNAHSKVCFLASLDCKVGASKSNKSDNNSNRTECPAEYNLSENQLCEAHKYQTCLNEKTGISLYKDLGCDSAAGYYAINSQTTDKKYICDAEVCGGCCNEFRCSDDYKSCLSEEYENVVGEGNTCTEKHEKYYVNNSPDKFLECNCDTEKYPYSINNCSDTLSGAHCKGDNGVYWKNCTKICEYEDKDECESTNKNFACIEVDGCYEPNGCKADYELVNNECIKSNPCEAYPYTSCPAGATKCETCENNGTTYYKAITCDESQGYYHSDGECKPRDCSDFTWDTCPPNSTCDSTSCFDTNRCISHYGSPNHSNDICISAGKVTYQLSYCGLGYFESGTKGCIKRNCENFDFTSRPKNMDTEECGGRYSAEHCDLAVPYVHYQNGKCVVYGDAACVNHKLTEIPANADYSTCSPDGGTTKYYQLTNCKSGYNLVDGACVEPSGVTETDYPFTTKEECTNGNFRCTYSLTTHRRYKRTRCAPGFHYDNGICIENDCSAYPFRSERFDSDSPYKSGPSCEKPLPADGSITDPDGRLTYIMLRECSNGYKFDPNGTDCIKSIMPPEARCYPNNGCSTNGYCPDQFTERVCKNSTTYKYWRECRTGYYFDGQGCVAKKCADFPFTSVPENSIGYAWCNKAGTDMYRAKTCKQGYRLNNHGCELNTCNGYSLTEKPTNAYYDTCYSGDKTFYKVKSCYSNYQLTDGVCVKK